MTAILDQISAKAHLISLPDVYLRLRSVLDSPNFTLSDVADVVDKDPAMTARLLRMVNSAYFGLATEIATVTRAVSLLGNQRVHDLVLAVSVAERFAGLSSDVMDMQRFWRKSVYCAIVSRELASLCNVLDSERLFVAGLLRDIGHLFLYQIAPQEVVQAMAMAYEKSVPLYQAERDILGTDYAQVGGVQMRQWRLPQSLWEPTECHIEPLRSLDQALFTSLVHIAALLTEAADERGDVEDGLRSVTDHAWQVSGILPDQCREVSEKARAQVTSVLVMFPFAAHRDSLSASRHLTC